MTNNKIDEIIEFIEQREGWSLKEFINNTCHETEMLKEGDIKISLDELAIAWGDEIIDCDLEDFINKYTELIFAKTCLMLNSFKNK